MGARVGAWDFACTAVYPVYRTPTSAPPGASLDGEPLQVVDADVLESREHKVRIVAGEDGGVVTRLVPGKNHNRRQDEHATNSKSSGAGLLRAGMGRSVASHHAQEYQQKKQTDGRRR